MRINMHIRSEACVIGVDLKKVMMPENIRGRKRQQR